MIAQLDQVSTILLDRFQHGFPLVSSPFAETGRAAGIDAETALQRYRAMIAEGLISRIGAVVAPNAVGVSTLAAMAVPQAAIEHVAAIVNAEPGVNHNYEREHGVNLWFVVSAPTEEDLTATLNRIAARTGYKVLDLRLEEPFHLDLGFSLAGRREDKKRLGRPDLSVIEVGDLDLLAAVEDGIPLVEQPYQVTGDKIGWSEDKVLNRLDALGRAHVIRRFGVVVRHRALGMKANAMAVWDVAGEDASALGERFAAEPGVTLCYRRRRAAGWPYNLYCMVHGAERSATMDIVTRLDKLSAGIARDHAVLFSSRCFRQTGTRFGNARHTA